MGKEVIWASFYGDILNSTPSIYPIIVLMIIAKLSLLAGDANDVTVIDIGNECQRLEFKSWMGVFVFLKTILASALGK